MSKSKLTLIIDGNWLLMSRLSVLSSKYKDDVEMCNELKILMIRSINVVLRQYPIIDNIIFVADGGSWRNYIEKPSFLIEDYKGTREPDPTINWDLVFSNFEELISLLKQNGITAVKEPGIEGDDWCWYWANKLNSEGTNVIIWSKDKDLTQLVKTDKNNCFTVCWNKDNITVEDKPSEELDFLFNNEFNQNEDLYNKLIDKCSKINKINPKSIVIDKIIRGDISDNILPIMVRKSKTNSEKVFRVSQKDIDTSLNIFDENEVNNYIDNLLESKSYKDRVEKTSSDIKEHFKYNLKLVTLSDKIYPQNILDTFKKYDTYTISNDLSEILNELIAKNNELSGILNII